MVPLHQCVFSCAVCTSLHLRPCASLFAAVSKRNAMHFTLSPFLYLPGAMTDGDDANEKFCHKKLDMVEVPTVNLLFPKTNSFSETSSAFG